MAFHRRWDGCARFLYAFSEPGQKSYLLVPPVGVTISPDISPKKSVVLGPEPAAGTAQTDVIDIWTTHIRLLNSWCSQSPENFSRARVKSTRGKQGARTHERVSEFIYSLVHLSPATLTVSSRIGKSRPGRRSKSGLTAICDTRTHTLTTVSLCVFVRAVSAL